MININVLNALINTVDNGILTRFKIIYQKPAQTSVLVFRLFIEPYH